MCTVTWERSAKGYELFCNRDERRTRKPAFSPRLFARDRLAFIAPVDGDFGGSWVGVNELGLTVCVINGIDQRQPDSAASRGRLVLEATGSRSVEELMASLDFTDLRRYRSFTLLGIPANGRAGALTWDGWHLRKNFNADTCQPFTSSSFESDSVIHFRSELFRSSHLRGPEFHSNHAGGPGPHSVCMHRPDAETVSFTRVHVNRGEISMLYSPHAPCAGFSGEEVRLA